MKYELNHIVTLASQQRKKPSKTEAHNILLRYIQTPGELSEYDCALLYAFFLPPVPAKPKTTEQWIGKAVASKKDVREYLQYLYSDGEMLVGTDGHRLHVAPTDLPEGYYDLAMNRVEITAKYPDFKRVVPKWSEMHEVVTQTLKVELVPEFKGLYAYRLPTGGLVNKRYWEEAVGDANPVQYCTDGVGTYRVKLSDERYAVIMGIRG